MEVTAGPETLMDSKRVKMLTQVPQFNYFSTLSSPTMDAHGTNELQGFKSRRLGQAWIVHELVSLMQTPQLLHNWLVVVWQRRS